MSENLFNLLLDPPNTSSSDEENKEVEETIGKSSEEDEEKEEEEDVSSINPSMKTLQAEKKKRHSEKNSASADVKRVKKVSGEEIKKNYFQRVWNEEDEIALLQGIIDYNRDSGESPYDDKNVFYERVKKSISFNVSKPQFMEKIRSLKKKFENNLGKGKKKNGEDLVFSKPHDRKAFDLSKLVWGDNGIMVSVTPSAVKSNGKSSKKSKNVESKKEDEFVYSMAKAKVESVVKKQEFVSIVDSIARFGVDELAAKQGWAKLSAEDKKRFEEQWKVLQIKEFKFYSQKSGFIHEVVTKMAEAFRPNP